MDFFQINASIDYSSVLIVDDEPFILDIYSELFSQFGVNVQAAQSPQEAYDYMQYDTYDLILTDVVMASGGFSQFLRFIKDSPKFKHVPMIAVTGVPERISSTDTSLLTGVIEKPFTPEEMLVNIHSILN
ncbi:MAG: response regulator [Candidatus Marinamargulisbacteria bacterium]